MFSSAIQKYNKFGIKQTRNFMITSQRIWNLEKEELKRDIQLGKMLAITKSTKKGNNDFIIHVSDEYDYKFSSDVREEIIEVL